MTTIKPFMLVSILLLMIISSIAQAQTIPCDTGKAPDLPIRLHQKVFDTAVNTGLNRANILLQQAINTNLVPKIKVDGKIGRLTLLALCGQDEQKILVAYTIHQANFYRSIVTRSPGQSKFLKGWLSRAAWLPPKGV
jgi:lysozyme family protein